MDFKGNLHVIEQLAGFLHDGEIGGATHDDGYERIHVIYVLTIYYFRFIGLFIYLKIVWWPSLSVQEYCEGSAEKTYPEAYDDLSEGVLAENHTAGAEDASNDEYHTHPPDRIKAKV